MHRVQGQGRSEGGGSNNPYEFWRPRIRNNDSWASRELPPHAVIVGWANDNIRRRLNGDRERHHEEFLMNLAQIQDFSRGAIESGELFRNDEVLQPIVDPDEGTRLEYQ